MKFLGLCNRTFINKFPVSYFGFDLISDHVRTNKELMNFHGRRFIAAFYQELKMTVFVF